MERTITIDSTYLEAHFKQPTGPSRRGIDWRVHISSEGADTVVFVRTYFSPNPKEDEVKAMADRVMLFIQTKLDQGWTPEPGFLTAD